MSIITYVVAILGVMLASALHAAPEVRDAQRIELRVDPGAFRGPGTWPLGAGVPLPRGEVPSADGLRLRGTKQGVLPVQVTPRTRWPDGSIKWIWVDFQGDPSDRYFLEMGPRPAPMPGPEPALKVVREGRRIFVDTGRMRILWDRGFASPTGVEIEGLSRIRDDGHGVYVVDHQGRKGILGGDGAELSWTIEDAGPIRAVVRVEGWYVTPDGVRLARAVVRYHLYAGRAFFTLDHTFIFTEDTDRLWFREVGVRFPRGASGRDQARFGVERGEDVVADIERAGDEAWIFQDEYPHFAETRSHFSVRRLSAGRAETLSEGNVAAGWCEAADESSGITVAVRHFAEQFPKELHVGPNGVTARLWSNRGGQELDYRPATLVKDYYGDWIAGISRPVPAHGVVVRVDEEGFKKLNPTGLGSARTHEIFCAYHSGSPDPATSRRWVAAFEKPPVAVADPSWLGASGAFWPIAAKDEARFPEAERFISKYFDYWLARMKEFPMTGWISYGVGPELAYERRENGKLYAGFYRLNNVAAYNTPKNIWVAYLRSGDRKYLDFAEPYTRFLADFKTIHWSGGRAHKEKGLLAVGGDVQLPLYWDTPGGKWDTSGQSTDYMVPFRMAYFLRDLRWARDALERYTDAMNRLWDLDTTRSFSTPFTHLSMMINAYEVTQDARLAEKIHALADALIDLDAELGFSAKFYTRSLETYDATYKFDRKIMALLDYYDLFGVEKAKQAVLKANQELFGHSCRRAPLSYQNVAPMYLVRCFEWTGNRAYRAAAMAHLESALRWLREFESLPAAARASREHQHKFAPHVQGFAWFSVPHILAGLGDAGDDVGVFPYVANLGRNAECPVYVGKKAGEEAELFVQIISVKSEPSQEPSVRVTGPDGKDAPAAGAERVPSHRALVYRIAIPAAAPAGPYRISLGLNRFIVIGCNIDKLVLSFPEGTYFGHRSGCGYGLTREKPYFFEVPEAQAAFTIKTSRPVRVLDPSGTEVEEARDQTGRIIVATTGRDGLWSFIPGPATFVRFEDLKPAVAFGDRERFFVPPGIPRAKPEDEWEPPTEEGLVGGRFGQGLHVMGKPWEARWEAVPGSKEFPFPEGTIECWIRTDWSTHWYPERSIKPFWTAPPFYFGYRNQPAWDQSDMFLTWVQFHPAWENRGQGWLLRASAYAAFKAGEWNHIACVWRKDPPSYAIYRNGRMIAELTEPAPDRKGDGRLTLGPLAATYDEFRVSRIVRYHEDFVPPGEPLVEDADTVLLFHFDEGLRGSGTGPLVEFRRR